MKTEKSEKTLSYDTTNVFSRILRGELPCVKRAENDHALAFDDISPQAPVHIVVIPKGNYTCFHDFIECASPLELSQVMALIHTCLENAVLKESGYRLVTNTGLHGQQAVPHLHFHILGGAPLGSIARVS